MANAFQRWSEVTRLNFTETESVNGSDVRILLLSFSGDGSKKGVVGGTWWDNTTTGWDVVLGSDEKWVLPGESNNIINNSTNTNTNTTSLEGDELDLESVVMHQIGHVLGLNHSTIEEAVMYPFVDPVRRRKVDLDEDDLKKIREVYGEEERSGEVAPAPAPVKSLAAVDGGGVVGVGTRWGPVKSLWVGIGLLFCFLL